MSKGQYESPLSSRYAGEDMQFLFSPDNKFRTWRRLWIALAEAERELGLPVTEAQLADLRRHAEDIDYEAAAAYEKKLRHDVMAHIHAYGDQCPEARPIIHLGATSCYVTDNTDILILRDALGIVRAKLLRVIALLAEFAEDHRALPTLGFTHFQPAQLTTVGKRATLWIYEFMLDVEEITHRLDTLQLLGSKGTTGTQASFLELFDGDHGKVEALEKKIAEALDFTSVAPVSGQTYSRKVDYFALSALSGVAQSASKFATDLRLLSHLKEIEEPYEKNQIGSSAMPYKRNPMRSERICALSRFVMSTAQNPAFTAATQWFERTLDDSANKRLAVPEAFLAVDAVLNIVINVASGLIVHEKVIRKHIDEELPFMASENILMDAVKRGGDRQALHERIRELSLVAGRRVKDEGLGNNLVELIAADSTFGVSKGEIEARLNPSDYVGRAPEQVDAFLRDAVTPLLKTHEDIIYRGDGNLSV
ncbi:adenylosuccinate lyase [Oscillospiraceae bacterium OttesenSCG-928-F05]|nr:adenylosuccinate lyase [Oscillospiraceae bacterium OttesenSCG-928-F05]